MSSRRGVCGPPRPGQARRAALAVLEACPSVALEVVAGEVARPTPEAAQEGDPLALYDDNGNGRITCAEARRHGIAPVHSDHPAYAFMRDGDGDGVVCE
ncbi:MAG: excalibur calcium-binding domain-containing protein [Caldilineaceae bacterium]|nr:excalibur calcium-binding domain-containing protein [Caldilineaceae bacterium]